MSEENRRLIPEIMEGSDAKLCGKTLLIYLREAQNKNRLEKYHELILRSLGEHLDIHADELRIIAYQDYVPVTEPFTEDDSVLRFLRKRLKIYLYLIPKTNNQYFILIPRQVCFN